MLNELGCPHDSKPFDILLPYVWELIWKSSLNEINLYMYKITDWTETY